MSALWGVGGEVGSAVQPVDAEVLPCTAGCEAAELDLLWWRGKGGRTVIGDKQQASGLRVQPAHCEQSRRYSVFAEMVWLPSSFDPVLHPEPFITPAESVKRLGHVQNQ